MSSVEDPEKILDQAVADMQNDLIKMRQASAQVVAAQKRLQIKADQAQQAAVRRIASYCSWLKPSSPVQPSFCCGADAP